MRARTASDETPMTFLCGGSRNFSDVIDLFDAVFVLELNSADEASATS